MGFVEWGLDARNSNGNVTWSVYETGMSIKAGTPVKAVGAGKRKEARVSKFGMEEQNRRWGKGFGKFFFCKICEHVSVKRVWIV